MMTQTIDMVPMTRNGEIVYLDAREVKPLHGLGNPATTQANLQQASQLVSTAAAALPSQPVTYRSDFSKVASTVGTIAGFVAIIPGIGWVAAAVCGIIAGVCLILGKLFGNSKAKQYEAERKQYEIVNAQIRYENQQLDLQYPIAKKAIEDLRTAFTPMSGLGSKASREKDRLESTKAEYELLSKEQTTKSQLLMSLVDEFNKLMKAKFELDETKSTNTWIAAILGVSTLAIGGYLIYNKNK